MFCCETFPYLAHACTQRSVLTQRSCAAGSLHGRPTCHLQTARSHLLLPGQGAPAWTSTQRQCQHSYILFYCGKNTTLLTNVEVKVRCCSLQVQWCSAGVLNLPPSCITENLCPQVSNPHSTVCFYELDDFRSLT